MGIDESPTTFKTGFSIRLKHLFYISAETAAAISLFGPSGLIVAGLVIGLWYYVYAVTSWSDRKSRLNTLLILLCTLAFLFCFCLIPSVRMPREAARRMQCSNNLKQIALGMHNYHQAYGSFPPAITYDASGKPAHSWRVLLLPFIEEKGLYDRYSFDEPWDGPNNSELLPLMPSIYRCPAQSLDANTTDYGVIVGDRTCFPPFGSVNLSDITDNTAQTFLVIEMARAQPWMQPTDINVDDFLQAIAEWQLEPTLLPHSHSDRFTRYFTGSNLVFADGSLQFWTGSDQQALVRKLSQIDDGVLTTSEMETVFSRGNGTVRIRWEGYFVLLCFAGLSILPVFWLRKEITANC